MLLLRLLSRLPKLGDLRLNVTTTAEPTAMAMLFGSMRTSLTGLQGLTWELRKPWHKAAAVWQELAFYTQLTELTLEFKMSVSCMLQNTLVFSSPVYSCTNLAHTRHGSSGCHQWRCRRCKSLGL